MTNSNKPKKKMLFECVVLFTNGVQQTDWFERGEVLSSLSAPVGWQGATKELRFWSYRGNPAINDIATRLLDRPGLIVKGPAKVILRRRLFFYQYVDDSLMGVIAKIAHLATENRVLVKRSRSVVGRYHVFSDNANDAFLVRMAL